MRAARASFSVERWLVVSMSKLLHLDDSHAARVTPLPVYASLFPLALAPFEKFLLQDERPGYEMVFYVDVGFEGPIDLSALREAVALAAARHPLLIARLSPALSGWRWLLPDEAVVPIVPLHAEASLPADFDLRYESGCRLGVRQTSTFTTITFQVHHACCDGEGFRQFLFDILVGYAALTGIAATYVAKDLDYARLKQRHHFQPPAPPTNEPGHDFWQKVRHAYGFHVLAPSPAAGVRRRPPPHEPLALKSLVLSREQTARIEQQVVATERTLNDVALALLFQTLAQWNHARGGHGQQRLRILMPTDLRDRHDLMLPAANRVGFSFLTRRLSDCDDFHSLVDGIKDESRYIRTHRLGLDFINIMASVQRLPGVLPLLLKIPRCMSTAVLTNLGDTSRRLKKFFPDDEGTPVIGNLRLRHVIGSPPLRPGMRVGVGLCICAGRLSLSLRGDANWFDGPMTQELLNRYVEAWNNWSERTIASPGSPLALTNS